MLDLATLKRIKLSSRPIWQRVIAGALVVNYRWRTKIEVEGLDNIPDEPVIYAMNHTDRYNYWPFQLMLYRRCDRFTATWVKGKYYENRGVGYFMQKTNNLPAVSRGYLITRDFVSTMGRRPDETEYRLLRDWVDGVARGEGPSEAPDVPEELLTTGRDMLGRAFEPAQESYPQAIQAVFHAMTGLFLDLHDEAFGLGLDLLVFPQGTRSKRLSRGRIGLAEIALHYKKTVVPVGCSGSDVVYPGGSPFAKAGRVVYRIGEPLSYEDMAAFHIGRPFIPFDPLAERAHAPVFQAYVDRVMARINDLVDPEYRFHEQDDGDGVRGADRFL